MMEHQLGTDCAAEMVSVFELRFSVSRHVTRTISGAVTTCLLFSLGRNELLIQQCSECDCFCGLTQSVGLCELTPCLFGLIARATDNAAYHSQCGFPSCSSMHNIAMQVCNSMALNQWKMS